jgi:hypothetical protein
VIGYDRVGELVHGHRYQQGGDLENEPGEESDRIVEEIDHPPPGAPGSGDSESVGSSGPGTR